MGRISSELDGGDLDCGVVKGLWYAIGFRPTDCLMDSQLSDLAEMLREGRDEPASPSQIDFLHQWYGEEYKKAQSRFSYSY